MLPKNPSITPVITQADMKCPRGKAELMAEQKSVGLSLLTWCLFLFNMSPGEY